MNPSELIEALRDADDEQRQEIKQLLSSQTRKTTRRGLMTAGAGVLSWLAVGQAAGQTNLPRSACEWAGNTDANGYDLLNLNALEGTGITGGERLTNIAGTNLTIDADGNLNASGGSSAGALTDSGTDTDGGDDYVLPNAADNIDLQGDGAIQNADTISGTSATLQSLSAEVARTEREPVYNVKHWGAKGDGSTDDTDAIQAALDAAEANGGGVVYLPQGTYLVGKDGTRNADELRPGDHTTIEGDGRGATIIKQKGSNLDVIRPKQAVDHTLDPNVDIVIRDLSVDGNGANQPTPFDEDGDGSNEWQKYRYSSDFQEQWLCGIRLKNVRDCHVENVEAYHATGYGLEYKDAMASSADNCWFYENGDDGMDVSDTRSEQALTEKIEITNCFAWGNKYKPELTDVATGSGFEVDDGPSQVTFDTCYAWDNAVSFDVHTHRDEVDPEEIRFSNCHGYPNPARTDGSSVGFAVYGYGDSVGGEIKIDNCFIDASVYGAKYGLWCRGGESVKVTDSEFIGASSFGVLMRSDFGDLVDGALDNVTAKRNGAAGFKIQDSGTDIAIRGCTAASNADDGFYVVNGPTGVQLRDCASRGNGRQNYRFESNASENVIQGCKSRPDGDYLPVRAFQIATSGCEDNVVRDNDFRGTYDIGAFYNDGVGTEVRGNLGVVSENEGTVTLTSGSTSVTVNHNFATELTPDPEDVSVTPLDGWVGSAATQFEVPSSSVGSSSFDIVVDADPTQDVTFQWSVA